MMKERSISMKILKNFNQPQIEEHIGLKEKEITKEQITPFPKFKLPGNFMLLFNMPR